ncbi:MAG: hypothetical protein H7Z74_14225 [Anaerolineae bacterium]|nr:hypothetical protein [Gemmatimonadaceae bacterium]
MTCTVVGATKQRCAAAVMLLLVATASAAAQRMAPAEYLRTVQEGQTRFSSGDWKGASDAYSRAIADNPHVAGSWFLLGLARLNGGDARGATLALEKALELGADQPRRVAVALARAHAAAGDNAAALGALERGIKLGYRERRALWDDAGFSALRSDERFRSRFERLAASADVTKLAREAGWRWDLNFLVEEIERTRFNAFRKTSQADFRREVELLAAAVPHLSDEAITVGVMRIMAGLGDAHTNAIPEGVPKWTRTLPVHFQLFEDGLFITAADSALADVVGAEVLEVAGRPVRTVLAMLDSITSDDNALTIIRNGPRYLRFPQVLRGLGVVPDGERLPVTIRDARGAKRSTVIQAAPNDPAFSRIVAHPKWIHAIDATPGRLPIGFRDRRTLQWFEYLPDSKMMYFQFNNVTDMQGESFAAFTRRLFAALDSTAAEALVIDMRWNNGGNSRLLPLLIQSIVERPRLNQRGKLFAITGPFTFSAAMNAATMLDRHTQVMLVGEPTVSSPNFVGESNIVILPWSGVPVSISDYFWQTSWPTDYRTTLAPELYTPLTFRLFRAKRDPAMEAIAAMRASDRVVP